MAESDLDLVYVGNDTDIVMFEGSAKEITEADFNAALQFGQEACQPIIARAKGTRRQSRQSQARRSRSTSFPRRFSRKPRHWPAIAWFRPC